MTAHTVRTGRKKEKALLVTVELPGGGQWTSEERMEELEQLAVSCGADIAENLLFKRKKPTPDLFIGTGQAERAALTAEVENADVVIFNNDLSPSQQQNIEESVKIKTIDRTQLILDIFARRARSSEGKAQVELAQLNYLLPRLSGRGVQLSRLGGGIGTRGPGEQKLEVDRRRVRERIDRLKRQLDRISRQRDLRRSQREKFAKLMVSLVGYTNSGKSTLFNALTHAHVKSRDQLFSTLDPTIRKMELPGNQTVLVSDTVGFMHDLPHHLIESFKATLEEVLSADLLLHVLDLGDERLEKQHDSAWEVLDEIGVHDKTVITVLNKSDRVQDSQKVKRIKRRVVNPCVISALKGDGIPGLLDKLLQIAQKDMEEIEVHLSHDELALLNIIQEKGAVEQQKYDAEGVYVRARLPRKVKCSILKEMGIPVHEEEGGSDHDS